MEVKMYTDGSSKGNPGPGGYGTIITYEDIDGNIREKVLSAGYKNTTNNRMELMGVIRGLSELSKNCEVDVYSDSQYVVNAFNKFWINNWLKKNWVKSDGKPVLNVDLWQKLLAMMERHKRVSFHWIKGHNGHPMNERCDKLAVEAASNPQLDDK